MGTFIGTSLAKMKGQKAIGCTLCAISCFFLIAAITNSEWALSDGWREGLFVQCASATDTATPLPFHQPYALNHANATHTGRCRARVAINEKDKTPILEDGKMVEQMPGYMTTTLIFLVIGLLIDISGTILTAVGLKGEDREKNITYNKIAIVVFAIAFVFLLIPAIIYPLNFNSDVSEAAVKYDGCMVICKEHACEKKCENPRETIPVDVYARAGQDRVFSFGFCYGVLALSLVFIVIAIGLLIADHFNPDPEEEKEEEDAA